MMGLGLPKKISLEYLNDFIALKPGDHEILQEVAWGWPFVNISLKRMEKLFMPEAQSKLELQLALHYRFPS